MRFLVQLVVPSPDGSSIAGSGDNGENCGLGHVYEAADAAGAVAQAQAAWRWTANYPDNTQIRVIRADQIVFYPLTFSVSAGAALAYVVPDLPPS